MTIRIGYDLFAAASAAGYISGNRGNVQIETESALKHKLQVTRSSDGHYWNDSTGAFQHAATIEAEDMTVPGSYQSDGWGPAIKRLACKLPQALIDDLTTDVLTIIAYPTGTVPGAAGSATMTLVVQ